MNFTSTSDPRQPSEAYFINKNGLKALRLLLENDALKTRITDLEQENKNLNELLEMFVPPWRA